jgi:TPR repeat protein
MYVNGSGVTRDEARGAELYRSACDLGSAEGCYALYSALLYGVGTPTDSRAALVAAEKACTLGHQDSCRIVELNDRFSKR